MEEAKSISYSETTITELMIPSYANFSGKVHGGILLSLMDKVAYVCAAKHSGAYCVTVSVDGVEFKAPVEVGDLVSLKATVYFVGNSSMIIGISVSSLKPKSGTVVDTNSCFFTMVAKNDDGSLLKVPKLILENEEQVRRFYAAKKIKKLRNQIDDIINEELHKYSIKEMISKLKEDRCVLPNI